jgi:hypothetical protein
MAYLATGPADFQAPVQPLLDARTAEGLKAAYADQEGLFDAYGFGRYGPLGIQSAVRAARPRYLLLVGHFTYDPLNNLGLGSINQCPTFLAATSTFGQVLADSLFGDLGSGRPEVAVGRLPLRSAAELSAAVANILSYKGHRDSDPYRGVLLADRLDLSAGNFHAEADSVANTPLDVDWTKIYVGATHATEALARTAVVSEVNGGADLAFFIGHGTASRLGKQAILEKTNVADWNGHAVLLMASCNGTWFLTPDPTYYCLVEKLMTRPAGVPVAIGSSTYLDSISHVQFMREMLLQSRARGARWGDALLAAQQSAFKNSNGRNGVQADLYKGEGLLGDPALPVVELLKPVKPVKPPPHAGAVHPGDF